MKAIILAAGYATRLYPLTKDMPKALLPIKGKPIIEYIIDELNTIEQIDEIIVVSNHKYYEAFTSWAKTGPVQILDDGTTSVDDRRGAIGDIMFTLEEKGIDDDTIIIAGDNLFTFTLAEYIDFFKRMNADCVCAKHIDDIEQLKQLAVAQTDEHGVITNLEEKPAEPKSHLGVYAVYLYKRETLPLFKQYIAEGNNPDAPGHFVQWLYKRKPVYAYKMNGDCIDIGTIEAYNEANA